MIVIADAINYGQSQIEQEQSHYTRLIKLYDLISDEHSKNG